MNPRQYLQRSSATAAAMLFKSEARSLPPSRSANDRIEAGVIGPGSPGREVLRQMLHVPGVELVDVADVYEPRFAQAGAVAGHPIFGNQPTHVPGTNSIARHRGGRTVGENTRCTFLYGGGNRMVFSSLTDNARQGNEFWVYGTEGSVQFTIEDAVFYYEKKRPLPKEANATVVERGVEAGASYSTGNEMPYRGPGDEVQVTYIDPTLACDAAFFAAVRGGAKPVANVDVGYRAAIACAVAHDAVFTAERTPIPAQPVA